MRPLLRGRALSRCSVALATLVWLVACSSHPSEGQGGLARSLRSERVITAKPMGGSPGTGPLIVPAPAPAPGGGTVSQQVVLGGGTLIVNRVTQHLGPHPNSSLIDLDVVLQNNGDRDITNQSTFFELIGREGDIFPGRNTNADPFYGLIAGHGNRSGVIEFEVPRAATAGLYLLYRPKGAAQPALVSLKIS